MKSVVVTSTKFNLFFSGFSLHDTLLDRNMYHVVLENFLRKDSFSIEQDRCLTTFKIITYIFIVRTEILLHL